MKVELCGNTWEISFPYNPKLVQGVKELPGRRYNSDRRIWTVPVEAAEHLLRWTDSLEVFSGALKEYIEDKKLRTSVPLPPAIEAKCYDYQKQGIRSLVRRDCKALLADEMGLGKSLQAIGAVEASQNYPAVVICPAGLKINWVREIKKWSGMKAVVLSGTVSEHIPDAKWFICNYDILSPKYRNATLNQQGAFVCICKAVMIPGAQMTCPSCGQKWSVVPRSNGRKARTEIADGWLDKLKGLKPKAVIIDECHHIKERKAQRTKAVQKLASGRRVIAISGTPITNRPIEFFTALNMVDPVNYSNHWKYAHRYCGAKNNGWGWDFTGASNTAELHKQLTDSGTMIRRLKEDVLTQLPPKQRIVLPIEANITAYAKAEGDFLTWIRDIDPDAVEAAERAEALVKIEKLKQLAAEVKMPEVLKWLEDYIDTGQKIVLFSTHHSTMDAVQARFGALCVRTNNVRRRDKQAQVDRFQNDPAVKIFLGSVKADGVGITLTAANTVAFLELPWTPGECDQAEDRIHRIGQTSASVQIYYLILADTIEEQIAGLLDDKRRVLTGILDGREVDESENLITAHIRALQKVAIK